jgi:uncharacterized membrane protein
MRAEGLKEAPMPAHNPVFSTREALQFGWQKTLANLTPLIILGVISGLLSMLQNAFNGARGAWLVAMALQLAQVYVGFVTLRALLRIGQGQQVDLGELAQKGEGFGPYFVTSFLLGLLVAAGFVLLIVPGVIWALRYGLAPVLVADRRLEPMAAFHESRRLTEGVRMELLGFVAVLLLVNLLGAMALGVGLLLSMPTTGLAALFVYRKLEAHAGPVPPAHTELGDASCAA